MIFQDFFNKVKWHLESLDKVKVTIIHRGAPNDQREILGKDIHGIRSGSLTLNALDDEGDFIRIPYSRILTISYDDKIIWVKKGGFLGPSSEVDCGFEY